MKSSEIALTVTFFTDYSKVFYAIGFSIFITKMHRLNFSKRFLDCIFSYLIDRRHFVQIDLNISKILYTNFGVPQVSILGPVHFNLSVGDMRNGSECIQYAEDSTIYHSSKPKNLAICSKKIESKLNAIETWPKDTNLDFNSTRTS